MTFNKIFFDFDGVLCHDYFYANLKESHPKVHKFINELDFQDALLIDDSSKMRTAFENRGGITFPYKTFEDFEPWMNENLLHMRLISS
nr:hypothetical protein [Candidatus Moranbacteria bacterium]